MMNQDGQPLPQIEQISGKRNSGIGLHDSGCCIFHWSASDAFSGSIFASAPTKSTQYFFRTSRFGLDRLAVLVGERHITSTSTSYDGRMVKARRGGTLRAIFSLLGAVIYTSASLHAQPALLDRFVDRNLWTEKPTQGESAQLERLIGESPKGFLTEPSSWHIWKTDRRGQTRYVVLLGEGLMVIPGGTSACVLLFDSTATMIRRWSFQTGWRIQLKDASLEHSADLDGDLLVIDTFRVINGRDVAKEIFAIGGDQLRLVRLEDSKGNAIQNEYVFANAEIGIVPEAQTTQEWTDLLQSKNKSDVLSALVFLGGRHLDEDARLALPETHESKYASLFQQLLASQPVRRRIDELSKSEDVWIRDAAALAARKPRERSFH
jgi:hypothetical protein